MVVRDLNHTARYAQHMVAIKQGLIISEGSPVQVMSCDVIREVFGIESDIIADPRTGVPLCMPYELADRTVAINKMSCVG